MKVLFICVNFNGALVTEKFVASVQQLSNSHVGLHADSVVIDNASENSDYSALSEIVKKYENVKLIRSDKNLGYFGGLNLGLINSDLHDYDYVMVGNNDLTFSPDFLSELSSRNYEPDVCVIAPNVITLDGYHQNPHCLGRVSGFRKFLYRLYFTDYRIAHLLTLVAGKLKASQGGRRNDAAFESQNIHMGIGACYILPKAFFRHYARLDDSVFLYGEEALLAGQVMAVGGKTYYDHKLIVSHAESATLSKLPSKTTYEFAKESYPKYRSFL
ncbi:glycosyltransferase family 2 protein [Collimonas humicola]|uniref:glycosyltransferase family 2 protein n=1 Tax=Collimonas humicola TaxID=2825886 RepID=UPI001B8B443B|nr:glycosyltransferase [Collimonas humicola]